LRRGKLWVGKKDPRIESGKQEVEDRFGRIQMNRLDREAYKKKNYIYTHVQIDTQ
jgi:hypothetical protein